MLGSGCDRPAHMRSMTVMVTLEIEELRLQISARQKSVRSDIHANGTNQPFNEWMQRQDLRRSLDFFHGEDPQIHLPSVEPV
jgi:hypothetical protein